MAMITETGYCPYCEKQVLIQKKGTSHILHLFLSIITCGAWLFVWLVCGVNNAFFGKWRCSHCGMFVKKGSTAADYEKIARSKKNAEKRD